MTVFTRFRTFSPACVYMPVCYPVLRYCVSATVLSARLDFNNQITNGFHDVTEARHFQHGHRLGPSKCILLPHKTVESFYITVPWMVAAQQLLGY
jgi:hypothetical protein